MKSHVTYPKLRRAVHKIMSKYGKKKFYRKIDWINKVLEKLKLRPSMSRKARIRNQINKWLSDNSDILENKTDNKKGILDTKPTTRRSDSKDDTGEKKNNNSTNSRREENQQQAQVQVDPSKPDSSNVNIPPMPEGILIKDLVKKIPVIDLASEDENTSNEIEIITIEDNDETLPENNQINVNMDEEMFSHQPSIRPLIPEEHYVIPDLNYPLYYNFYDRNNCLFYPFIGQTTFG